MKQMFPHLMSPIRIRNTVIKNRLVSSTSVPHFISGPEGHPNDHMIEHLAKRAANGAGIVTVSHTYSSRGPFDPLALIPPTEDGEPQTISGKDPPHFPEWDIWTPKNQNYMIMLNDAIHYYGGKSCLDLALEYETDWDVTGNEAAGIRELNGEKIETYIQLLLEQCALCPELGFDMITIHAAYRDTFLARFLSPATNRRTDSWGGSLENRAKVPLEIFRRIKEQMGQDFITSAAMSATDGPDGYTLEDFKEFCRMADGLIDIIQVRMDNADDSHPTGYLPPNPTLALAAELKTLDLKYTKIMPIGGFQDPYVMEDAIAAGKADLIAAARMWIADPHWGEKLAEGRPEDITPCILCNRCHVQGNNVPFLSMCSVNPEFGIQHVLHTAVKPVRRKKRVAVVGGGPGGLRAALYLRQRGHQVTLYERTSQLGGALTAASQPAFKWPVKRYLEWLIRQVEKSGAEILLNTEASPELLQAQGFDAVIAAVGGKPVIPPIPGVDGANVLFAADALNRPELVQGRVAVIGGGGIGTETAIHFAQNGHPTVILEMRDGLAEEDMIPHVGTVLLRQVACTENLKAYTGVQVTSILADGVRYTAPDGAAQTISCDTVILAVGTAPRLDEGMAYWGILPESFVIGDCTKPGNLAFANRAAFAAANNI